MAHALLFYVLTECSATLSAKSAKLGGGERVVDRDTMVGRIVKRVTLMIACSGRSGGLGV